MSLAAAPALSQSAGSGTRPSPGTPASSPPPVVHYHFHQHNYPSAWNPYPYGSASTNPYNPGPYANWGQITPGGTTAIGAAPSVPTAGQFLGPFAPLPVQNSAPNAPTARGVIHVFLPTADATVYLNGQKMRGKGKDRRLTTDILPMSREYQYWVTASFKQNGESVTDYRKVDVGAGEYTVADFTRPAEENPIKLPAGPVDPNTVAPDNNN